MGVTDSMDAGQIEERLLFVLRDARHDDLFSGACAVDLVMYMRTAAATMVAEGRTSEDDLAIASQNLTALLVEMDEQRVRLGLTEFQERTLSEALARLCPGFWPFC